MKDALTAAGIAPEAELTKNYEMLRDDLESKGPVRLSEVEQAQKEVLAIARRMADAGEISLGGGGDQFV